MTQVVLVSHGRLAEALLSTARMIAGDFQDVQTIGLEPGMGIEDILVALRRVVTAAGPGGEVLALLDLFGGSPSTACARVMVEEPRLEVVTGVNLPMLLEVLLNKDSLGVIDLARLGSGKGKEGIIDIRVALGDGHAGP